MINPLLDPNARIVIAHRGNRAQKPENTIEAFLSAIELGADAVEFDVRMSRDGVPVVMHDPTLDRTTSGHGKVANYSLADLRTVDAGARSSHGGRARIPTLEEALDAVRNTSLIIEVKERGATDATMQLVERFGAKERVLIGSSDNAVVARFRELGYRVCASMADALRLMPVALFGLRAGTPSYHVLSITPNYNGIPIPVLRMAAAAHRMATPTQVWTVNDPTIAQRMWAGGVAGIVTDDPAAILRVRAK